MAIPPSGRAPIDETAALGENVWILDYYTRSKVECERLLWRMAESEGLPLDGDPPELALWRARSHHRPAADPRIPARADVDRGKWRQSA